MSSLAKTIIYGTVADVENAIGNSEPLDVYDEYGFTPIVEAAIMNKVDVAQLLLKKGASVDFSDLLDRTALFWACDNNNLALCKLLLENRANPNSYSVSKQSPLVYPLLRRQLELKNLLYAFGANLDFAQDFINTKLIGHRFALIGQNYVVNPSGDFVMVDFEGFIFEFTSSLIQDSLHRFSTNYSAKHLQHLKKPVKRIIESLKIAAELLKYQQYSTELDNYKDRISELLDHDLLVIPIVYKGHAITGVKYQNIFIKCDRGEYGRKNHCISVYKIKKPGNFSKRLIMGLLYKRKSEHDVHYGLTDFCGFELMHIIPIEPQISGNCSWANVEALIPALLFLILLEKNGAFSKENLNTITESSLNFFYQWLEWDQDRAINECIQSFNAAEPKRKITKVQLLAQIFVNRLLYNVPSHVIRAEKILPILRTKEFDYVINAYIKELTRDKTNLLGKNLTHLLDIASNPE